MKIILNGKEHELNIEMPLTQLLHQLDVPRAGTAVAINGAIVPRDRHDTHKLVERDRVDILRAIGGG
ncbi:MAG: sulfur carrier protein ThiS [bacterium]